jgi:hypothetical protein
MKRHVLFFATIALLMVASVSAQEKFTTASNDLPAQSELITVQDDRTGNYLVFSITNGEYKFIRCKDQFALSGFGKVKVTGCSVTLEDIKTDRRVLASIDECTQTAKASITLASPTPRFDTQPVKELLTDVDMRDSTTDCTPKIQPQH